MVDATACATWCERTVAAARLGPADPALAGPGPAGAAAGARRALSTRPPRPPTPDERAARVRAFVDAAGGLETAGYCRTSATGSSTPTPPASAVRGARDRGGDGRHRADRDVGRGGPAGARPRLADLDGAVLGARAAAKARAGADPVELPPGRYEVVLEPTAVADLLQILAIYGFNGKAFAERQSFVELGAAQFDPAVTLVDDAGGRRDRRCRSTWRAPRGSGVVLVDAGVSSAVAHDRRTAAKAGADLHRARDRRRGQLRRGAADLRLLRRRRGRPPAEVDGAGRRLGGGRAGRAGSSGGCWSPTTTYTRVLDPRTLVVTGLTRNGVWLIEDGVVTTPVRNFRFTQSYPQALAPGAVLGVGRARRRAAGALVGVRLVAPGTASRLVELHRRRVWWARSADGQRSTARAVSGRLTGSGVTCAADHQIGTITSGPSREHSP